MTVFERNDRAGGLLQYGIPTMKLSKEVTLPVVFVGSPPRWTDKETIRYTFPRCTERICFFLHILSIRNKGQSYDNLAVSCNSGRQRTEVLVISISVSYFLSCPCSVSGLSVSASVLINAVMGWAPVTQIEYSITSITLITLVN